MASSAQSQKLIPIALIILLSLAFLLSETSVILQGTESRDSSPEQVGVIPNLKTKNEDSMNFNKISPIEIEKDTYFSSSESDRYNQLSKKVREYASQRISCQTKYVSMSCWCDSNPGNGLNALLRGIVFAFILDRLPLIFVHRKEKCFDFLAFKRLEIVYDVGSKLQTIPILSQCGKPIRPSIVKGDFQGLACTDFNVDYMDVLDLQEEMSADLSRLSEILHNHRLTSEQRQRALKVFDIGVYTSVGLIMREWFEISDKVINEFHDDYRPHTSVFESLRDPKVLKVGLHVRHLPFVVKDEKGFDVIDKRALRCLDASLSSRFDSKAYSNGCLVLLASDMLDKREATAVKIKQMPQKCNVVYLTRTGNSSSIFGGPSYSEWEKRDPHGDPRGVLEAYLDAYLLSEFANYIVFSTGSTFSQFIGFRASRRMDVVVNFEFASSSCKKGYLPYPCCHERKRWDEINFFMRNAVSRCK